MQPAEPKPDKAAWPVGTPSRYGPIAGMIYNQTRLEFRAHDGQPDAVETLLSTDNRQIRLRMARAIGHAAHCLREDEGLSNDVVNLVHEANRLIARRPIPPRRRKMDLMRVESFLTQAGIGTALPLSAFPADELPDPHLRLRLDFIGHNSDNPYPNVITRIYDLFRESHNLTPATEPESTTPPLQSAGSADALVRSSPVTTKGPGVAGSVLPAALNNLPAKVAAIASVILFCVLFQSPPFGDGSNPAPLAAANHDSTGTPPQPPQSKKVPAPPEVCSYEQNRPWLGDPPALSAGQDVAIQGCIRCKGLIMKIRQSDMPEDHLWATFFSPAEVLNMLGLTVACRDAVDFGCDCGTFSILAARIVPSTVHAFDIDPAWLPQRKSRCESRAGPTCGLNSGILSSRAPAYGPEVRTVSF